MTNLSESLRVAFSMGFWTESEAGAYTVEWVVWDLFPSPPIEPPDTKPRNAGLGFECELAEGPIEPPDTKPRKTGLWLAGELEPWLGECDEAAATKLLLNWPIIPVLREFTAADRAGGAGLLGGALFDSVL